jgi:ATP-dependent DNA helicase RecG
LADRKADGIDTLEAIPLSSFKGIGPKTLERLIKLGLNTAQDLLFHLPLRYENRTRITPIARLRTGDWALIEGRIAHAEVVPRGRRSLVCRVGDATGLLSLRFFHFTADQSSRLKPGTRLQCFGEVRMGYYGLEMTHPEYRCVNDGETGLVEPGLTPVYPLTDGIHQKTLQRLVAQALALCTDEQRPSRLIDLLPPQLLVRLQFPSLRNAIVALHAPEPDHDPYFQEQARRRLAFEELLAHQLSVSQLRRNASQCPSPRLVLSEHDEQTFRKQLPFVLTTAQKRVTDEIAVDLRNDRPMMRLVQGDVGSGKTVVAALAALTALASGYQVAVMAPTELLAEQHFRNFNAWLGGMGFSVEMLSAKVKGAARGAVLERLAIGEINLALGTHALFQQDVHFQQLGLIIIDEQHRFGVHQRLSLREKGRTATHVPHQLIMTATPIPRTLAMLSYADLDISVIDELPPGRKPVITSVIPDTRRDEVIARIREWLAAGRQVYWVCTLIEESETLQCEAAEDAARKLNEALPNLRVGLVHGRLKTGEKDAVMQAFKTGETGLLVATTVIEVGLDVPNARLMVIENAERLGLAQLHQLRGRVGRGDGESHCVLMYRSPLSATAKERLGVMRQTNDGFVIAERDLQLRGPGELLGVRQTGQVQFRIADLARDSEMLAEVKNASDLLQQTPQVIEQLHRRWLSNSVNYSDV